MAEHDSRRLAPAGGGPVLQIRNLQVRFFLDEGMVRAVDDVSLSLHHGATLGIVGESGCGKSVTARAVLQVVAAPGRITGGQIWFHRDGDKVDIAAMDPKSQRIRQIRGDDIAMIFQEPMAAFSPIHTIGRQISEQIRVHRQISKKQARARVLELLGEVGIPQPARAVDRYPFELSGGLRQRAMIAMALSCDPLILIADEPTTALDVTVQAQILALLKRIQNQTGMSLIIISHNMGVIAEMADHVAVMYLGRVIEQAPAWELFDNPHHPYTQALLTSIPMVEEDVKPRLASIKGNVPNPYAFPPGCRFHPRCNHYMPGICNTNDPPLIEVTQDHQAACFLLDGESDHP